RPRPASGRRRRRRRRRRRGRRRRGLEHLAVGPGRVELVEELGAAGLLVGLADATGLAPEAVEGPEEPEVLGVGGPHVAGAPPAGLAQGVEPPVVADPEGGVALDVVAGVLAEPGPAVEEPGEAGDHGGDGVAAGVAV